MKRISISIDDLLVVLESMKNEGTTEIVIMDYNNYPGIYDKDNPDNIISFQSVSESGELNEEDETKH